MQASIRAQGGVVFGIHQFPSEEALTSLVMKTHPKGTGLAAFCDASSLFCHDNEIGHASDPHNMLSRMVVTSEIDRNYRLSFKQGYPPGYLVSARSIESGDKLFILALVAKWRVVSNTYGKRQHIVKNL